MKIVKQSFLLKRIVVIGLLFVGVETAFAAPPNRAEASSGTVAEQLNVAPGGGAMVYSLHAHTDGTLGAVNVKTEQLPAALGSVAVGGGFGVGVGPKRVVFKPSWSSGAKAKPGEVGRFLVQSTDGGTVNNGAFADAWLDNPPGGKQTLNARARLGGAALFGSTVAALAIDPIEVPPGNHPYQPDLSDTVLSVTSSNLIVLVDALAEEFSPTGTVWSLAIVANYPLSSPSDLDIQFSYDPGKLTITDPDPGNPGPLAQKIIARVRQNFSISAPGTAQLEKLTLFDAVYHVTNTVQFGNSVGGGIAPLPSMSIRRQANAIDLSWPDTMPGFSLETSSSLGTAVLWQPVTNPIIQTNGNFSTTVFPTNSRSFFRLRSP